MKIKTRASNKSWLKGLFLLASLLSVSGCLDKLRGWQPQQAQQTLSDVKGDQQRAESHYRLALGLIKGIEGESDDVKAATELEKAARLNHREAQYLLSMSYALGRGIPQDDNKAHYWLEKSAEAGYHRAQLSLGKRYLDAKGVAKETSWGMHWVARSAVQGDDRAQYILGVAYASGLGVQKQLEEAWLWLSLSRHQGYQDAQPLLDKLRPRIGGKIQQSAAVRMQAWRPVRVEPVPHPAKVRFVQYSLSRLGFDTGAVDGWMGPNTRRAIEAFNRKQGQAESGGRLTADLIGMLRSELIRVEG